VTFVTVIASNRKSIFAELSGNKINAVYMLSLLWVQCGMSSMLCLCCISCKDPRQCRVWCSKYPTVPAYVLCYEFWMVYEDCVHFSLWL